MSLIISPRLGPIFNLIFVFDHGDNE